MERNKGKIIVARKKNESVSGKNTKNADKNNWTAMFLYWLFIPALVVLIVYSLFFSGYLSFREIRLEGNQTVKDSDIREVINDALSTKYLNVISADNYYLLFSQGLEKDLYDRFRMIEEVRVKKIFPNRLDVFLKERKLVMAYCRNDGCYAIDESGRVFGSLDEINNQVDKSNLIFLYDESPNEIPKQDISLESPEMEFISRIRSAIENETGLITEKTLKTPSLVSRDYRVKTLEGWEIYLSSNLGIQKEVDMLKVVLKEKISDSDREKLQYIDLRNDNKVFYRLRQDDNKQEDKNQDSEKSQ